MQISKSQLKPRLLNYLRKVERQKVSITVTDRGHPVARIIPFREPKKDPLKELKGTVIRYDRPLEPVGQDDWDLTL